ncbi:MAG: TrmH family RNA methyltransferase [Aggregatilineales bacterium]
MITSTANARVRLARALQTQVKARRREGRVALEGLRLMRDAVASGHQPDFILYTPGSAEIDAFVNASRLEALAVSEGVMRHISDTQQPQGIVGVFPAPRLPLPALPQRALLLDALRDPGNLGTILRTAAAAGVDAVLLAPGCVDPFNPKVLRAGMGAHFRVPVAERDWHEIETLCAPLAVYLADARADLRHDQADWSRPWALIVGGEASGAGQAATRLAQARIAVPMASATESLNAAAAAAVILFEARRQAGWL